MTRYLFIHQNFPGQFPHIARALADRGDEVVAVGEKRRLEQRQAQGADVGFDPEFPSTLDWQLRIARCHDGIDTQRVCTDPTATIKLPVKVGAGGTVCCLT